MSASEGSREQLPNKNRSELHKREIKLRAKSPH